MSIYFTGIQLSRLRKTKEGNKSSTLVLVRIQGEAEFAAPPPSAHRSQITVALTVATTLDKSDSRI